jgi:hypothetical protein
MVTSVVVAAVIPVCTVKDSPPRRLPVRILIAPPVPIGADAAAAVESGYRRFIPSSSELLGASSWCSSVSFVAAEAKSLSDMTRPGKWVAEALASRSALTSSASTPPKFEHEDPDGEIFGFGNPEEDDKPTDDARPLEDDEDEDEDEESTAAPRRSSPSGLMGVSACGMVWGGSWSSIGLPWLD